MTSPSGEVVFYRQGSLAGRVDFCEPQLNLLAHAQTIELQTGSRCGGHGICGGDRIRVHPRSPGDLSPVTDQEIKHLTSEELADGYRLACQCYPNFSDLRLSISLEY